MSWRTRSAQRARRRRRPRRPPRIRRSGGDRCRAEDAVQDVEAGRAQAAGGTRASLYRMTKALERQLSDVAWAGYRLGDDLAQAAVDLGFDLASLSGGQVFGRTR